MSSLSAGCEEIYRRTEVEEMVKCILKLKIRPAVVMA